MNFIIGIIITFIAFWIYEIGFCQIFGSIACTVKKIKQGLDVAVTIIIWLVILGAIFAVAYFWLDKYIAYYLIGAGIALIVALSNIPNLLDEQIRQSNNPYYNYLKGMGNAKVSQSQFKNYNYENIGESNVHNKQTEISEEENSKNIRRYMRFGISCFASIQLPSDWYFEKADSANYVAMKSQTDGFIFEFIKEQVITASFHSTESFYSDIAIELMSKGYTPNSLQMVDDNIGLCYSNRGNSEISKVMIVNCNNGFLIVTAAFSDFSDGLIEEKIESILKTLSVDGSEDRVGLPLSNI